MLRELNIKNVAVIDEVTVEFGDGFNVLTGETGAGKSILIDSIGMALGARVSRDLVRTGCDFASVSLCFEVTSESALAGLAELEIEPEDGMVIISRRLGADGKSSSRINGRIMPLCLVRDAADVLIDIHGQNDNRSLLSRDNHLSLLDEFGHLSEEKKEYSEVYSEMRRIKKEIKSLSSDENEKERRLELLNFQIEEITAARLTDGEDEALEAQRDRLYNMESIVSGAGEAYSALYGGEEYSAYDLLRRAARSLSGLERFAPELEESSARLESVIAETEDIASELNACLSGTDFSMAELDRIEERLDLIGNLKRKYGNSVAEIHEYCKKAQEEADGISRSDERLEELKKRFAEVEARANALADALSEKRRAAAEILSERIMKELAELDMPKARFEVCVTRCGELDSCGCDEVEFMISANPGEALKPMSKIASGGELSRIMLAMKTTLSDADTADTMIFDEIDTGVSGRAAQKIAEKICALSAKKQVFSITHLAQLASMADSHFLIEKTAEGAETRTNVRLLGEEERVSELARIIGGVSVTELTRKNAREMIEMAAEEKKKRRV